MGEQISQATEDAIVSLIMSRLVEKTGASGRSLYAELLDGMPDADRALVEAALERHEARQRARGVPGW